MEKEYFSHGTTKNRSDKEIRELLLQAEKTGIEGFMLMTRDELIAAIKLFSV
jgi:hypothetical protein